MTTVPVTTARAAYEGYAAYTRGLTWDDKPMPTWDDLPDRTRGAWAAAIAAALAHTHQGETNHP